MKALLWSGIGILSLFAPCLMITILPFNWAACLVRMVTAWVLNRLGSFISWCAG